MNAKEMFEEFVKPKGIKEWSLNSIISYIKSRNDGSISKLDDYYLIELVWFYENAEEEIDEYMEKEVIDFIGRFII